MYTAFSPNRFTTSPFNRNSEFHAINQQTLAEQQSTFRIIEKERDNFEGYKSDTYTNSSFPLQPPSNAHQFSFSQTIPAEKFLSAAAQMQHQLQNTSNLIGQACVPQMKFNSPDQQLSSLSNGPVLNPFYSNPQGTNPTGVGPFSPFSMPNFLGNRWNPFEFGAFGPLSSSQPINQNYPFGLVPSFLPGVRILPKRKRLRTAFSPSQLIKLENAFVSNPYMVGQERKELAKQLNLSETQVHICS